MCRHEGYLKKIESSDAQEAYIDMMQTDLYTIDIGGTI